MDSVKPLVSIVVTVFNTEKYIARCINSLLSQDYAKIEIIIVDDGSSDNSLNICKNYAINNNNIVIIHKENEGCSRARLSGIKKCSGDYIGFVDSDDWIEADTISQMVNDIEMNTQIIVGGYVLDNGFCELVFRKGKEILLDSDTGMYEMFHNEYFNWSMCDKLYKKELLNEISESDYYYSSYGEDTYKNFKLFQIASKILYRPLYKYHYCLNSDGMTKSSFSKQKYNYISIYDEILKYAIENNKNELKKVIGVLIERIGLNVLKESRMFYDSDDFEYQCYLRIVNEDLNKIDFSQDDKNKINQKIRWLNLGNEELKQLRCSQMEELKKIDIKYQKKYIYGAGKIAEELTELLEELDIDYDVIVTKLNHSLETFKGKKIQEYGTVKDEIGEEVCILLAMKKANIDKIYDLNSPKNNVIDMGKYSFYYLD